MKQQIICPKCKEENRKLFPNDNPYPNEYLKRIDGLAKRGFICDLCGIKIPQDTPCTAYTIYKWNNYSPWENDFIKENHETKQIKA